MIAGNTKPLEIEQMLAAVEIREQGLTERVYSASVVALPVAAVDAQVLHAGARRIGRSYRCQHTMQHG